MKNKEFILLVIGLLGLGASIDISIPIIKGFLLSGSFLLVCISLK